MYIKFDYFVASFIENSSHCLKHVNIFCKIVYTLKRIYIRILPCFCSKDKIIDFLIEFEILPAWQLRAKNMKITSIKKKIRSLTSI